MFSGSLAAQYYESYSSYKEKEKLSQKKSSQLSESVEKFNEIYFH